MQTTLKRTGKSRDSPEVFYDRRTKIFYNQNLWNINNIPVIRESCSDCEFIKCVSAPHAPTSFLPVCRVSSQKSIVNENDRLLQTPHFDDCEKGNTAEFTLRLEQKQIHKNQARNRIKSNRKTFSIQKYSRPSSAALMNSSSICEEKHSRPKSAVPVNYSICCKDNAPTTIVRKKKLNNSLSLTSTEVYSADDESSVSVKDILRSYMNDLACCEDSSSNHTRLSVAIATPLNLSPQIEHSKFKAWVNEIKEPIREVDDSSDLIRLIPQSKNQRKLNKKGHRFAAQRQKDVTMNCMLNTDSICRGSNWCQQSPSRYVKAKKSKHLSQHLCPLHTIKRNAKAIPPHTEVSVREERNSFVVTLPDCNDDHSNMSCDSKATR